MLLCCIVLYSLFQYWSNFSHCCLARNAATILDCIVLVRHLLYLTQRAQSWPSSEQLTNKANKTHPRTFKSAENSRIKTQLLCSGRVIITKLAIIKVVHLHNKLWGVVQYQWWLWIQQWKWNILLITQLLYSFSVILLNIQGCWFGYGNYYWHVNHEMCKEKPCRQNFQTQKCHVWIITIKEWLLPCCMSDGEYIINNYEITL